MNRQLIAYLPPIIQSVREFQTITAAQQEEFALLTKETNRIFGNQYVDTTDDYGLSRWEKILQIIPKGDEELSSRRFRVKSRINEQLPFTLAVLKLQLESLCGTDGYSVMMEGGSYTLLVRVTLGKESYFEDVRALLERIVPAAIAIDLNLKFNTHKMLSRFTHKELAVYQHKQLQKEAWNNAE